jgi:hypothetical protein
MTPQERELLTNLVTRLRAAPAQQRDSEAEEMIAGLVRDKPDTPYVLAQTVLIQDYALHQAQGRIADLEQQLQGQKHEGGFLSSIFGSGRPPQPAPRPQPAPQPAYATPQPGYAQPGYAQPAPGPWGAPQPAPQGFFQQGGQQPSFLRSAATTAAGVAGGALLFEGIESLMGGHGGFGMGGGFGGAGFGGFAQQPGITETVVNNYYDAPPGADQADFQQGGFDNAPVDQSGGFTDAGFDDNSGGFDGGGDFGGGDFSSDV